MKKHDKPVEIMTRADGVGYTSNSFKGLKIAVEHHGDGSITVCKEICDEIYADKDVPLKYKKYFKPTEPIVHFSQ